MWKWKGWRRCCSAVGIKEKKKNEKKERKKKKNMVCHDGPVSGPSTYSVPFLYIFVIFLDINSRVCDRFPLQ